MLFFNQSLLQITTSWVHSLFYSKKWEITLFAEHKGKRGLETEKVNSSRVDESAGVDGRYERRDQKS